MTEPEPKEVIDKFPWMSQYRSYHDEQKQLKKSIVVKFKSYVQKHTQKKDFEWIMQHLTSPCNTLKGCEINILESVFFKSNGKVDFIAKNDKDGCVTAITQKSKLQMYKVLRMLQTIIRSRKLGESEFDITNENLNKTNQSDSRAQNMSVSIESDTLSDVKFRQSIK